MDESKKTENKTKRKEYYLKNKEKIIAQQKQWVLKNKDKSRAYKQKHSQKQREILRQIVSQYKNKCNICEESNVFCLEFHHRDKTTKEYLIPDMIRLKVKPEKLIEEINKCDCLCSNCHRKHHHKNFSSKFWKIKYVQNIKNNSSCIKCSESHWSCLDFHHKNSENKVLNIGAMLRDKKYTIEDIQAEIDKCEIICSNCHRKEHIR